MIFVAGTLTIDPEVLVSFERDVAAMVDRVRSESGCLHYSLLVENAAVGLVNVLEQWSDDAALQEHLKQPWIVRFLERHGPRLRASTVRIFDISGERPLPS